VFDPKRTGLVIEENRRLDPTLADDLIAAMHDPMGRPSGESYKHLNKALYFAIHRTLQADKRDKDLATSAEYGNRAGTHDGLSLYQTIKELASSTKGASQVEARSNLMIELRTPTYVPGKDGIKTMFKRIEDIRADLSSMQPPTIYDDAMILLDVYRVLIATDTDIFTAAKEQIENNEEDRGTTTTVDNAQPVLSRFQKRLIAKIKANPRHYGKLDLTNIHVKQASMTQATFSASPPAPTSNYTPYQHSASREGRGKGKGRGRGRSGRGHRARARGRGRGISHKRARLTEQQAKQCAHHPESVSHWTSECANPYSSHSLWSVQGNEPLSLHDWRARQKDGLGPPPRTHGTPPMIPEEPPQSEPQDTPYGTNPRTSARAPPRYQQNMQRATTYYNGLAPQPPHLAANTAQQQHPSDNTAILNQSRKRAATTQPHYYQQQLQHQVQPQPMQRLQQQQRQQQPMQRQEQLHHQLAQTCVQQPHQHGRQPVTPTGYDPRTVHVSRVNARNDLQPVDAMATIMDIARQYGSNTEPEYPSASQVSDFGRGGSFPRHA
jgi:hypothetical protein